LDNTEVKPLPFSQDSLRQDKWVAWEP